MTRLETRPEELRRIADTLWDRHERGHRLRSEQVDALAEAFFRIAVHPGTASDEALSLLAKAHSVDPVNPKHPYHAGLIHLRHGRLAAAMDWLTVAAELAPANHRIWAHLSVVHQNLHEQLLSDPDYNKEQRDRAVQIVDGVRAGQDDLAATDVVTSLLRPGECRWSGIHDINAEFDLRRTTANRTRDLIAEALQQVARLAGHRPGGTAAFAVLATQWLVHGYPSATVRRLAGALPPGEGPAREMVDLVCELFEIDETALPERLAACLAEQRLPDLLVALIHQRRLLWRPLRFPELAEYTAARRFAENGHGPADAHIAAMKRARRALADPVPPRVLSDVATSEAALPDSPEERLGAFERDVEQLEQLDKRGINLAKQLRDSDLTDADRYARARADQELLADVAKRLEATRVERVKLVQDFQDEVKGLTRAEDFDVRLELCIKALQQPIGLKRMAVNVKRKLASHQQELAPVPPSSEAVAIGTAADQLGSKVEAKPAEAPREFVHGTPQERVAAAVAYAESALAENVARAWQSLDAYPSSLGRRSALVLLRSYLNGHVAETRHRMGQRTQARRHWHAMVAENPMSAAVLHNLAVAHTAAGDLSPATQTWNRYLETLYAEALLTGTPTRGAAERAEVHRVLAGSFGTAALCGRSADDGMIDAPLRGIPAELTSPARASLAVAHLRLEELNRALSYRSAVLRLGVARSVRRDQLDEAFDARLDLVTTACAPLPERVRVSYEELCFAAFQSAYEAACEPGGRTREATDAAEEEAHAAWAQERIRWKQRIFHELTAVDDWPVTGSSGEILASLRPIDDLRLDKRDEAMRQAAVRIGGHTYLDRLNNLSEQAGNYAVDRIYRAAEQRLDSSADFPERYRRIYESWRRNGVSDRYLDLLDDPQGVYAPSIEPVMALLNSFRGTPPKEVRDAVIAVVPAMEHWVHRLKGASGPAAMLGELLSAVGEQGRARPLLQEARAAAFARESLASVRLAIECEDFSDATARITTIAERRKAQKTDTSELRHLMITAYQRWIGSSGPLPTVEQIRTDLGRWSGHPDTVHAARLLVVEATITRHKRRPGELDTAALTASLHKLCREDERNSFARYQLVQLLYQRAVQIRTKMRATFGPARDAMRGELTQLCKECADQATTLLTDLVDSHHALADDGRRHDVETIAHKVRSYRS